MLNTIPRKPPRQQLLRTLVRRFWGLCAFLLIGLAVVVTVGRELAPRISDYRAEIEGYLSEAMGVEVTIGSLAASWEGLSPELHLRQVRIINREGEQILAVDKSFAELNLLRSLFNWELAVDQLEFVDIALGFEQGADGMWSLRGLPPWTAIEGKFDINHPLDIFLFADHIRFREARFSFDFRTDHSSHLELPHLVLENQGDFHRLRSEVAVDQNRDVLTLVVEAFGDPRDVDRFTARGYLHLNRFELDKALAALPGRWWDGLPDREWRKGHQLNLEAWFNIEKGRAIDTRGHLKIGELPLDLDQNVAMPKQTEARFAGSRTRNGQWRLAFRDVLLEWDQVRAPRTDILLTAEGANKPVHLQLDGLNLADWSATARQAGLVKGRALEWLDSLQPEGRLENVKISMTGTRLEDFTLRANLNDVSVGSWRGAPELRHLDGYVEATPLAGFVDLASERGFSMRYPTLYREPQEFDRARGRVHWRVDPVERSVKVHSGLLSAEGKTGEGRGYFSLSVPLKPDSEPEELIVQVGIRDSQLPYLKQFVPYRLPEPLRNWLGQSVEGGKVSSGGFIYRGGFTPGAARQAAVQLFLDVENASLSYHPDWPELEGASGLVRLDDRQVLGNLRSGQLYDTQVEGRLRLDMAVGKDPVLYIAGRGEGLAGDGLRLIRETPLRRQGAAQRFRKWEAQGSMETAVDLTVPLGEGRTATVNKLDVALRDARLGTGDLGLNFEALQGAVNYDRQRGLYDGQITGQLWGRPLKGEIEPPEDGQPAALLLTGPVAVESLRQWSGRPELIFLKGETDLTARLSVPVPGQTGEPHITLRSDLQGLAVELPRPLGKAADESRHLTVSWPLSEGSEGPAFRYGSRVHGVVALAEGGFTALGIGLNEEAVLPPSRTLAVSGELERFETDEWQPVLERYREAATREQVAERADADSNWKRSVDVRFDRFSLKGFTVDDLHLVGEEGVGGWQLTLDSPVVAGRAQLSPDGDKPLLLELDHLHVPRPEAQTSEYLQPFTSSPHSPESGESADPWAQLNPSALPAMDIAVNDSSVGGEDLGSWSFELRPTDSGAVINQIVGNVRGGRIVGLKEGQGAELLWEKTGGQVHSQFNGRFVTDNLGSVLEQWGQPHLLDSESSRFDARLAWTGSPAGISLTGLRGDVAMSVEEGTFIRGAGEATTGSTLLELLSFFNFDTWFRRLRLDFSDLSRAGTSFQSMDGDLEFDQGKMYMKTPLVVNSTSSRFQMAGVVDLVESNLDTKLVATIPVGGNLTFVAALAGMGLPTVAGMWLISKLFDEQIGKMSSLSFNVTGPLQDPDIDFVRLFDDQVVRKTEPGV